MASGATTELVWTQRNSFLRRIIHQTVRNEFPTLYVSSTGNDMHIRDVTDAERADLEERKRMEMERCAKEAKGFRRVLDCIVRQRKPVIGHNLLLDLCHTMRRFYGALPDNIDDWKRELMKAYVCVCVRVV